MSGKAKNSKKTLAISEAIKYNVNTNRKLSCKRRCKRFQRFGLLNSDITPLGLYIKKFFYRRSLQWLKAKILGS